MPWTPLTNVCGSTRVAVPSGIVILSSESALHSIMAAQLDIASRSGVVRSGPCIRDSRGGEAMKGTSVRSGPFWDAVEKRAPMPRAAATLGLEFIGADPDNGTIELAFAATDAFTNPAGNVLGAFLAAMLYDTVGPALLATLDPDQ